MTAWDLLIAHSSLTSGTAWEHLNAQVGGGSGDFLPSNISVLVTDTQSKASLACEPSYTMRSQDSVIRVTVEED
jgi:hypothetical protein